VTTTIYSKHYIQFLADGVTGPGVARFDIPKESSAMTEHTKVDHSSDNLDEIMPSTPGPTVLEKSKPRSANMAANKVECNACPVLCQITEGRTGACDRWGNVGGVLTRIDPVVLMRRPVGPPASPALNLEGQAHDAAGDVAVQEAPASTELVPETDLFVSGVGSGTTYPDYKPAPFIVASKANGVDMVTVVTEGIFSYCSFKVKID